jgi:Zn finger protein HypA/HybF involved in hydrogenase expression
MKKKRKCYVCGAKLTVRKESVYTVCERKTVIEAMTEKPTTFDVMDCPQCGCQQLLASRMPRFDFIVEERKTEK